MSQIIFIKEEFSLFLLRTDLRGGKPRRRTMIIEKIPGKRVRRRVKMFFFLIDSLPV